MPRTTARRSRCPAVREPVAGRFVPGLTELEARWNPATFEVNTLSDNPADGLTLREAITDANNLAGKDTITFAQNLAGGTILLGSPDANIFTPDGLVITESVSIQGIPGDLITVEGAFTTDAFGNDIFAIQESTDVLISDLRVRSPQAENNSGISNDGTVTLRGVTITDVIGSETAFENDGTAILEDVTIADNTTSDFDTGGGITNFGTLTIRDSRITGNKNTDESALAGGILHLDGSLTISDTEISGNTSAFLAGGLAVTAFSDDTTTTLTRVQFLDNTAQLGGGLAIVGGFDEENPEFVFVPSVQVSDSTFDGNSASSGAGIAIAANDDRVAPQVTLADVVVTNNTGEQNASGTISNTIQGITFTVPRGNGGGVAISRGDVTITDGSIDGNKATVGGGLAIDAGTLIVDGTAITGNMATVGGGLVAVQATDTPDVTIAGADISDNSVPTNATGTITFDIPDVDVPDIPRGVGGGLLLGGANVAISDTTVNNNTATGGAGIGMAQGSLTLVGTTISRNTATGSGASAVGGGIVMTEGMLAIENSTISGNTAPSSGGIGVGGGTADIAFSTIVGNTGTNLAGGIGSQGQVDIRSTVVARNTSGAGPDVAGAVVSGGNNFIGIIDGSNGFGAAGDQSGTTAAPLDPRLAPLANYGGPTETHLPLADSPLLDAAGGMVPPADQRGVDRPVGAAADIGAVERQPGDPNPVPIVPPDPDPDPDPSAVRLPSSYTVGPDAGGGSVVRLFNPDGTERLSVNPGLPPSFTGGVRVAEADLNGDGTPDIVVGTGPGIPTQVWVFDGETGDQIFTVNPFEASFTGGVYVAAGDITGDGVAELVITPDEGGGPRVQVYAGNTFGVIADFFGIDDPNFRGGARAAIADVNGDGIGDLIVSAGFGGGPRVAVFDGTTITSGNPVKLFNDIFAFEETLRNGVFVAGGDVNGDGNADLILGGGPGGGPRVRIADGLSLLNGVAFGTPDNPSAGQLANFFGGDANSRGGIRVTAKDLDGDAFADVVVGAGTGAGSRVTSYLGKSISPNSAPPEFTAFDAFPGFAGGVFVG